MTDDTDAAAVIAVVEEVADELVTMWRTAHQWRAYRQAWPELAEALTRYPGVGGMMQDLWRHAMLAACRRLIDQDDRARSVVTALRRLGDVAEDVTVEVLVVTRKVSRDRTDEWRHGAAREELHDVNGTSTCDHLRRGVVEAEITRLRADHQDVVHVANRITAHDDRKPPAVTVGVDDLESVLVDVIDVCDRWVGLLRNSGLDDQSPRLPDVRPASRALEMFDWQAYVEAVSERHAASDDLSHAEIEQDMAIGFVWLHDDWP